MGGTLAVRLTFPRISSRIICLGSRAARPLTSWYFKGHLSRIFAVVLCGVISANIAFQILLCRSPMLLFSFLRNSFMQFLTLLRGGGVFPFQILFFTFLHSLIGFRILLLAFEFFYNSIAQSSHAVLNPIIFFHILSFTLPVLLCRYESFHSVSSSIIHFPIMFFQIRDFGRWSPWDQ